MFAEKVNARAVFGLLCGLAICCSVMYISADGDEVVRFSQGSQGWNKVPGAPRAGPVSGEGAKHTSYESVDKLKAGQIYTETPDGRMRLMDYFGNVEKEISQEVADRKSDIASVRAQMARDFAFNAKARSEMKKELLKKMAENAAKAKAELDEQMRLTQLRFAKMAALENKRYAATLKRDKTTLKVAAKDKAEGAHNLKVAVSMWQKSLSAWGSATNAKINKMNKHVAANAAQMKENAKKARKALEGAMHNWDQKIANFRHDAKKGRSKLAAQFADQDAKQREWANNKIKSLVARTASQFNAVETKMAKNRHEVDMAIMHAAKRFDAALNANKALEDERYASTVTNLGLARKEAADRVAAAKKEFKVNILRLSSVVAEQNQKVNSRIDKTAQVVRSNKAAQAKVNTETSAELNRMIKLGNKRYAAHLKNDSELKHIIAKDKAAINAKLDKIAMSFNAALGSVRKQLKKDRAHAESRLKKATAGVWSAMWKQQAMQKAKNNAMLAATRRMRLDAMDNIRKTKAEFIKKCKKLGKTIAKNDKAADKKIEHLTGVVKANDMKSRKGRELIAAMEEANKNELHASIRKAIDIGEKRATLVEKRGVKMDKDVRTIVNFKLSEEISKLRKETNASVEALALQSSEARAEMRKEMLYAIRSAAAVAKADLEAAVTDANSKFIAFAKKSAASHSASAAARGKIASAAAANKKAMGRALSDAVATVARNQLALKEETAKAIKKSNKDVAAHAHQMEKNAKKTAAAIKAMTASFQQKIADQQMMSEDEIVNFNAKDMQRQKAAKAFLTAELAKAEKRAASKFGAAYVRLAKNQAHFSQSLAGHVTGLNNALAKQAALADSRFAKTVKDLSKARAQAASQVAQLRKGFAVSMAAVRLETSRVEQRIVGSIGVATGELISLKANQLRVNRRVDATLKRIVKVSDTRFSSSKRARGKLKLLMDENKGAAHAEITNLGKQLGTKLEKLDKTVANHRIEMAKDLSAATKAMYEKMASNQRSQEAASKQLGDATAAASAATAQSLKRAKAQFAAQLSTLSNTVAANQQLVNRKMAKLTGVVHNIAKAGAKDRNLIKMETKAMQADLNRAIVRAIQIGETKAKAVEQRIGIALKKTKRFLQTELSERCEAAADATFKAIQGKRQVIADNYLSLKAYAVTSVDRVSDYVAKGKGRNLSSMGDLLQTVGGLSSVKPKKDAGLGMGGTKVNGIFQKNGYKVPGTVAAMNGLVDEYTKVLNQVRARWPMGLGKYLLLRTEESMLAKGILQVDKVDGKPGNFVYINGHSVGLSNKLSDFQSLASRMSSYEGVLAKLTSELSTKRHLPGKAADVKPPQWQGN
jgi:hypothetical protein